MAIFPFCAPTASHHGHALRIVWDAFTASFGEVAAILEGEDAHEIEKLSWPGGADTTLI